MMISFFSLSSFSHTSAVAEPLSLAKGLDSETICLSQEAGIIRWFLKLCFAEVRSPIIVSYKDEMSFTREIFNISMGKKPTNSS